MELERSRIDELIKLLEYRRFEAHYFDSADEAKAHLLEELKGYTIGMGSSKTIEAMELDKALAENNTVYWHWYDHSRETMAKEAFADVFISSANGMALTGEIINIDGGGNRVSMSLHGHKRMIYLISVNKIEENFEKALWRARNIAAPLNARRLHRQTPCALTEPMRCHDCNSPGRVCNGFLIETHPMHNNDVTEVILIGESMGY